MVKKICKESLNTRSCGEKLEFGAGAHFAERSVRSADTHTCLAGEADKQERDRKEYPC